MAIETIGIVGAGAWGTALAQTAARAGRKVVLWARDPAVAAAIGRGRANPRYLPDVALDPAIRASKDLAEVAAADAVLLAVPAQTVREVCRRLSASGVLVICAKGFETATGARLSEVVAQERPQSPCAVLSGPNFAGEVARGLPAAATLGCADATLGRDLAEALSSANFRAYWTEDVIGVEVGGALKNVLAIAAGIVAGRGLGENARAAIITRGLAELARLGEALGGRRETLMGLSGLGDLVLSASSLTSRNMAFGHAIGRGADPQALRRHPGALVEGVFSAGAVARLAAAHALEMPISAAVDAILEGRIDVEQALDRLMRRPIKPEAAG
ncbi:MAG TPA: NAD(P)H-dependent glycerol-3-phosphate dehydrogenase [Geminicoccaceae bacterium]|nr:NAD(P)H-dependent glycerol-3-phosphate dehydrogenase [Geminicoccaceae bacterium]